MTSRQQSFRPNFYDFIPKFDLGKKPDSFGDFVWMLE